MKLQDLLFFAALFTLLYFRNSRYFVIAGIACLVLSIPLFGFWVFFTAQRLTWYAGGFLLTGILIEAIHLKRK